MKVLVSVDNGAQVGKDFVVDFVIIPRVGEVIKDVGTRDEWRVYYVEHFINGQIDGASARIRLEKRP